MKIQIMAQSSGYDFVEWVKYMRKNIFTSSQQQFGELLEQGMMQGRSLGDRYIGVLEARASTIRIDVLEQILKMMGIDFQEQIRFYNMALEVARPAANESKKIYPSDFLSIRQDLRTAKEPSFIKSLDESTKSYIYNNLVNLDNNFYGTNRLVDMQSFNYFWTVVLVEYYIMTQSDSALSETTSKMIQEKLKKILTPIVDKCEEIFERTATKGIAEGKNKFNEIRTLIAKIDITFSMPKSKREQLEYKVNLRTQRITECFNLVLSNYLDKMLKLLRTISEKRVNFLLLSLSAWSKEVLSLMDSLNQLLRTGNTDNGSMSFGYKNAISNNHIELIYDMSVQVNRLELGSRAIDYLKYLLPEYDEKLIVYLCNNESDANNYKEWREELTTILSDRNWMDKYAGPYAELKNSITNYLYLNNIPIQDI